MSSNHDHSHDDSDCDLEKSILKTFNKLINSIKKTFNNLINSIKSIKLNNCKTNKIDTIQTKLNVICMLSNPIGYRRRIELAKKFIDRMSVRNDINLFITEIVYNEGIFEITEKDNKNHLRITTEYPLWHKENAINMCVKILPDNWESFCWIDMDIIFENEHWVSDSLKILSNKEPTLIQLFSHAIDMDFLENPMTIFQSFAYQHCLGKIHNNTNKGLDYWHPGYAWGMNRSAYEITGGLYELSIIGSGDYNIAMSLINKGIYSVDNRTTNGYKNTVIEYQNKIQNNSINLKYVPGIIRHEYHGSKVNRKYVQRNDIIIKNCYNPTEHLIHREDGLLIPTEKFPKEMLLDIINYFKERNEDEH